MSMNERDVLADIFENEDHMGNRPYDLADALIRHLNKRGYAVCHRSWLEQAMKKPPAVYGGSDEDWLSYFHAYMLEPGPFGVLGESLIDDMFEANDMPRISTPGGKP